MRDRDKLIGRRRPLLLICKENERTKHIDRATACKLVRVTKRSPEFQTTAKILSKQDHRKFLRKPGLGTIFVTRRRLGNVSQEGFVQPYMLRYLVYYTTRRKFRQLPCEVVPPPPTKESRERRCTCRKITKIFPISLLICYITD